ncbi:hypothetical protein CH063_06650, partial [Colletotrichum higginsianum]
MISYVIGLVAVLVFFADPVARFISPSGAGAGGRARDGPHAPAADERVAARHRAPQRHRPLVPARRVLGAHLLQGTARV